MQELRMWNLRTRRTEQVMVMNSSSVNRRENVPTKQETFFSLIALYFKS